MKFAYSKKVLFFFFIMGVLWTGIGLNYFYIDKKLEWNVYATLILGTFYIVTFLYKYSQKYFEITEGKIKINSVPKNEIDINEINEVKYYANDYIFKTTDKTLKIAKSQINKTQLLEFEIFFKNIKVKLDKENIAQQR